MLTWSPRASFRFPHGFIWIPARRHRSTPCMYCTPYNIEGQFTIWKADGTNVAWRGVAERSSAFSTAERRKKEKKRKEDSVVRPYSRPDFLPAPPPGPDRSTPLRERLQYMPHTCILRPYGGKVRSTGASAVPSKPPCLFGSAPGSGLGRAAAKQSLRFPTIASEWGRGRNAGKELRESL